MRTLVCISVQTFIHAPILTTHKNISCQQKQQNAGQSTQTVEKTRKTDDRQSEEQVTEGNITRKDTADITEAPNRKPETDSSATDLPQPEASSENIDAKSLEDLFKEADGQIL